MITTEQSGARHVDGPGRGPVRGVRSASARVAAPSGAPVRRPVVRDRRGPGRPAAAHVRGAALCPSPVLPRARPAVPAGPAPLLRRVVAGIGVAVASAAAVVGLGLLADVAGASAAGGAPVTGPVPVVVQP